MQPGIQQSGDQLVDFLSRAEAAFVVTFLLGAVAALVVLVLLQSINNRLFDPLFEPKPTQSQPP